MEKIAAKDVTEALARAMELADDMKTVVVIYETKDNVNDRSGGVITNKECEAATMNYLLDRAKHWLLNKS